MSCPATSATRSNTTHLPGHALERYAEIAPKVKDICERYGLPYNSGRMGKQFRSVQRTILLLAFPGGSPRPKPGPHQPADEAFAAAPLIGV